MSMSESENKKVEKRTGITGATIRRPVGTIAIASVVIVLGFFFLERLAVDLLPTINYPQIRVTVNYPGTAPEVMEQQVTRVLEANLAATENLVSIESRASEGRTNVNLIFEYGTNIDLAIQDASRNMELARTQLPPDIDPPRLYKFDPSQDPVYEAGFTSSIRNPMEVRDWLETRLSPQLQSIHGVGGVEVAGGMVREIQIIVDQERLSYYGIPISYIEQTLEDENIDLAAGQVTSETFDVMAKTDGRFRTVEEINDILIPIPDSNQQIHLHEIAQVVDGHQDQRIFVRLNGQAATQLSITKLPDANTLEVINGVKSEVERLRNSGFIPADINFEVVTDQSFFIESSIGAVSTAAIIGGILAMLVVLLFLGSFRKAFIISISIPIAILATFAMMGMSGLTLNIMSLGGLALGVGLLLDNSIVMLENIYRHHEELKKPSEDAAFDGAKEVTSAVIASTMTNLAAVVPFLLITGLAAMIFQELIITISFAILASLAAALTLVPTLSALFNKIKFNRGFEHSRFIKTFNHGLKKATNGYLSVAKHAFRLRIWVVGTAFLLLIGSFYLLNTLGNEFLPQVDDGNVGVNLNLPPGSPPDVTNRYALMVEEKVNEMPHVNHIFGLSGGHLGGGILNERPGTARFSVQLTPASQREISAGRWVVDMQEKLDELEIPGARLSASPPSIPGIRTNIAGADISIGIVGDDIETLDRLGRDILPQLQGIQGMDDIEIARDDRTPLLSIQADRQRAADYGMNVSDVGRALQTAVGGSVPTRYSTGITEYDVRVMLPRDRVTNTEDLSNLLLFRENNESIRLGDVATFTLTDGPAHIERENQVRIYRINGNVNREVSDVGTVNSIVRDRLQDFELPEGYTLIYGGEEEVIQETNRNLLSVTLLALFLVFVVMAVQYERLANPLVILTAAPLALIGVALILWIADATLGAPVLLGVILLVGIVVNNAILLVEYIEIGKNEKGLSPFDAALDAGRIRFRPILMTTLTTVCGMLPLAIGMGEGAELMQPLALSVVGGLLISTLLTLFVIPSLYLIVDQITQKLKQFVTGSA